MQVRCRCGLEFETEEAWAEHYSLLRPPYPQQFMVDRGQMKASEFIAQKRTYERFVEAHAKEK